MFHSPCQTFFRDQRVIPNTYIPILHKNFKCLQNPNSFEVNPVKFTLHCRCLNTVPTAGNKFVAIGKPVFLPYLIQYCHGAEFRRLSYQPITPELSELTVGGAETSITKACFSGCGRKRDIYSMHLQRNIPSCWFFVPSRGTGSFWSITSRYTCGVSTC